jgi:hypothetical protein
VLRIRARYADQSKKIIGTPALNWPAVCACCGIPQPQTVYVLEQIARHNRGGWGPAAGGVSTYIPETGYQMLWNVPCCQPCLVHAQKSHHPFSLFWTVIRGGIPTMFLGGFILFSMGVADDPDAMSDPAGLVIAIAFVILNFVAWVGIWQLIGAFMRWRGSRFVTPMCADPRAPVAASSNYEHVRFDFTNDRYAWGVAQANGLWIEPARFTTLPWLADLGARNLG